MADSVAAYQDALRKLKQATAEAEAVARVVADAGRKMGQWKTVVISNASGGGGYPHHVAENRADVGINARDWPSAEAIHKALVAYHDARLAAHAVYNALPEEQRT